MIEKLNEALYRDRANYLPRLFPNGTIRGGKLYIGDIYGNPGESMPIPLNSGSAAIMDFAGSFKGNDFTLYKEAKRLSTKDAIKELSKIYNVSENFSKSKATYEPEIILADTPNPDDYKKLNLCSIAELTKFAIREGLTTVG